MYISRLIPRAGEKPRLQEDRVYALHQWVWKFFEDGDKERKFIYRFDLDPQLGRPVFYVVSAQEPQIDQGWDVTTKDYDPQLTPGETLRFQLRINPVKAAFHFREEKRNRGKRVDIVIDLKHRLRRESGQEELGISQLALAERAGREWLLGKAEANGFEAQAEQIAVERYISQSFQRSKPKLQGEQKISMSTMDLVGSLKVVDPAKFRELLFHGIGHGKGFGCGLMLVKRP